VVPSCRFCKKLPFDARQISTLLSIMNEIFLVDAAADTLTHNMHKSFEYFQELVIKHSVERPPKRFVLLEL
jgi:hypothetical protein